MTIINVRNQHFNVEGDGFTKFHATDTFEAIVDSITDALIDREVETLSEEDLLEIGDRACSVACHGFHDPNAFSVCLSRA